MDKVDILNADATNTVIFRLEVDGVDKISVVILRYWIKAVLTIIDNLQANKQGSRTGRVGMANRTFLQVRKVNVGRRTEDNKKKIMIMTNIETTLWQGRDVDILILV